MMLKGKDYILNPVLLSVTILRREYEQKIPFRAIIEKLYVDGSVGYQVVEGVFKGNSMNQSSWSKYKILSWKLYARKAQDSQRWYIGI